MCFNIKLGSLSLFMIVFSFRWLLKVNWRFGEKHRTNSTVVMEGISGEINRYSPVDQSGSRDAETENLLALWQSDRPGQVRISKPCQPSAHIVCNSSRSARVARQTSILDVDAAQYCSPVCLLCRYVGSSGNDDSLAKSVLWTNSGCWAGGTAGNILINQRRARAGWVPRAGKWGWENSAQRLAYWPLTLPSPLLQWNQPHCTAFHSISPPGPTGQFTAVRRQMAPLSNEPGWCKVQWPLHCRQQSRRFSGLIVPSQLQVYKRDFEKGNVLLFLLCRPSSSLFWFQFLSVRLCTNSAH